MVPIKRSEALQPLSRQHHNGLLFCLLLEKGIAKQTSFDVLKDFSVLFFKNDLTGHFIAEEEYLHALPFSYPVLAEGIGKMMAEHAALRHLIILIEQNPSYELFQQLHVQLKQHIRFEERVLFNLIDATIDGETSRRINIALKDLKDDNCMNYPIKFWE
jgi:hypothetical protein